MNFSLPNLSYALNDLEPSISELTMKFHYGKHHQAYVDNLNKFIIGTVFENRSLEEIIKTAPDGPIFNNAAQVWNHTFYFEALGKAKDQNIPTCKAIEDKWGNFDVFKEEFSKAAIGLFGSGWLWLVEDLDGKLQIVGESNAGNPMRKGWRPILCFDVWEHAYYLDYQNKRADYIKNLWTILDWNVILKRF
ncbi:MAG: superoxide dismutase [Bacteroidales bacterium]|nr:superoxide dismutase [Bacteroidales bacterium]